jgi:hypothetical protein
MQDPSSLLERFPGAQFEVEYVHRTSLEGTSPLLKVLTAASAYKVGFWVLLILFLQSQNVYQLFEKINEQCKRKSWNLQGQVTSVPVVLTFLSIDGLGKYYVMIGLVR